MAPLENQIFEISNTAEFEAMALEVFRFQYMNIAVYREFCDHLGVTESTVRNIQHIPFLPIEFFKQHAIIPKDKSAELIFQSSGTTAQIRSRHHVAHARLYEKSFLSSFSLQYGDPKDWVILALLPSYLEQGDSSLVYMTDYLIKATGDDRSGFYLHDMEALANQIMELESLGQKTLLIGVSYALLDLLEIQTFRLKHTTVLETGGMKGRRKEMVKDELHAILKKGFGIDNVHSEYGMTELLSQAYSTGKGAFACPPWMKVLIRDPEDALSWSDKTGGINIIDLANLYSCSFIATQDLGKINPDGSFQILGRFDFSDIRGCNLMVI